MADTNEKILTVEELGGIQRKTSRFLMQKKDLWDAQNVSADEVGSIKKRLGYTQRGSKLTSTTTTSTSTSTTTTSTSTSTTTSTSTSTSTS